MAIDSDDIKVIAALVGRFENGSEPYLGATGDFDGQGISCGVLQWNIGQGSLQPMIVKAGEAVVHATMPAFGQAMWEACTSPIPRGLAIVRGWQSNKKLLAGPRAELKALMGSPTLRQLQDDRIASVAEKADVHARAWADARGTAGRSKQELAFFFDLVTQNGSMKGLSFSDVAAFKAAVGNAKADDLICDWLAGTGSQMWGHQDAHKNAQLWRDAVGGAELDLLVFAYLRSQKSVLKARADVLNRNGTIATRRGHVHAGFYDLTELF
ncbi:MAG: peptidoglycan-binding domain 1 protein [Candidatus Devosia phytovorans]|uniref:Peptidoglycan-binding domain 1 protein n=1 Tax=Candidatus Devosia phytovorans TaxID=3121372 RepID=A0AAJ5VS88_9HYPH|nr:peptidoglycan-binding domain 1 protein [Devosia sp.]WEK03312.1 MAG: peptidoglycan-binding domain 1 protein [Devosia sp.]